MPVLPPPTNLLYVDPQRFHAPLRSGISQVTALVEDAVNRLEPDEDAANGGDDGGSDGDFPQGIYVSVGDAVSAIGGELRDRISHALASRSLEELVELHRVDMPGLQVGLA